MPKIAKFAKIFNLMISILGNTLQKIDFKKRKKALHTYFISKQDAFPCKKRKNQAILSNYNSCLYLKYFFKSTTIGGPFLKQNSFLTPLTAAALAVYFFSGVCSLTYEVIWQRLLKLILGNTTYATSITVAVFLGGLAIGSLIVGKKADAIKNKLLVYGIIEIAVAFFALLTPFFLKGMDHVYIGLFQSTSPSPSLILALQVLVSTVILAVPTVLMGCTLPILASLVSRNAKVAGWETGILYGLNTVGALVGVSATGFYLIRLFGVYPALYSAVGLNVGIGLVSCLLSRFLAGAPLENTPLQTPGNEPERRRGLRTAVFIWLFIMGLVALGYEIVWVRTVIHLLKAEIYTFSSVLCIYLFGYAAGIFAGAGLSKKASNHLTIFGVAAPLVGLCGILYFPMLTHIVDSKFFWNIHLLRFLMSKFGYLPHLYLSMLFFFAPSFFMGMCFPPLIQLVQNLRGKTGNAVSVAYGINTIGCVVGSIGTGFFLIPSLGTQTSIQTLGILSALSGLSALFFVKKGIARYAVAVLPAICIIVVIFQPKNLFAKWINKCEGKGTYQVVLLDVKEGITTTASVHQYADGSKVISTAGVNVAGDALPLRQTQKFQGHFPVIMQGNVKSVVTIGFGSGELTKLLTLHGLTDITCVEISPEMVYLSRRNFSHINLGADLEKHVRMVYMDAKNFMHLTSKKFDVIENDCIWPGTFAESSSLYTREYFLDAKRRLNDQGVFSTWLTLDLPETTLLSIIKTFSSVFENTVFVYPHYAPDRHILLMGQKNAHPYNYRDAQREFEKPKVKESLAFVGVENLNDLLGCIMADDASLKDASESVPINSDYFPFVEFDMNRTRQIGDPNITWENLEFVLRKTHRPDFVRLLSFAAMDTAARDGALGELVKNQEADEYLLESFCNYSRLKRLSLVEKGLKISQGNKDLLRMKKILTE